MVAVAGVERVDPSSWVAAVVHESPAVVANAVVPSLAPAAVVGVEDEATAAEVTGRLEGLACSRMLREDRALTCEVVLAIYRWMLACPWTWVHAPFRVPERILKLEADQVPVTWAGTVLEACSKVVQASWT